MNYSMFEGNLVASNRIIYTSSAFAKSTLLHLQEVGELQARKPHVSKRKDLVSYLFFVVEKGAGTLHYDGVTYSLQKGDCVFIDCSHPYSHCSSEDLWNLKWTHFYGPMMPEIYDKYVNRGGIPTFATYRPEVYGVLLNELLTLAASDDYVRDMKINEKLSTLLTMLMEESWQTSGNALHTYSKRDLTDIRAYLDTHYREKITLDELAESFYINKYYLTRLFKEQFGHSINTYLTQKRITHAKELLRFSTNTMDEISRECGFNDGNYFVRTFKKVEGITPGEYRKRW